MRRTYLYAGTWPRTYRTDQADTAFGIYGFGRDERGSSFSHLGITETPTPGWIAMHPKGRFLYAVNEVSDFEGKEGGGVTAFAIDPNTGTLTQLNSRRTPSLPAHCCVDSSGDYLVVACYGGGAVQLFPLQSDGRIGPECHFHQHSGRSVHPERQSKPHPHSVNFDPAGRFVFVPDLGLDRIFVYELDRDAGQLAPRSSQTMQVTPGSGPRHMAFDPRSRFVYVIHEMSSTIGAFAYNAGLGALQRLQSRNLLPAQFEGYRSGAEIAVHPSGMFVYASTRSHGSNGMPQLPGRDLIVWCAIDQQNGTLGEPSSVPSGGDIPRSFTFDSTGEYLYVAHQGSGTIVTFRIDLDTGKPYPTRDIICTPNPVCLHLISSE